MRDYEELVAEAAAVPLAGWDFGWLAGRATGSEPSWSYPDLARPLLDKAERLLDIDTGGGELLASLLPLPGYAVAVEGWPPNVGVATQRLAPLGVTVLAAPTDTLPLQDGSADLVLNRHGRLASGEVARVLCGEGTLLTQQVGSGDCAELNAALGAPPSREPGSWTAAVAATALEAAGLRILDRREEWPALTFRDIGAVVYQLRAVPWQVPDFTLELYGAALRSIDAQIRRTGEFTVHAHRFLLVGVKDQSTD